MFSVILMNLGPVFTGEIKFICYDKAEKNVPLLKKSQYFVCLLNCCQNWTGIYAKMTNVKTVFKKTKMYWAQQ